MSFRSLAAVALPLCLFLGSRCALIAGIDSIPSAADDAGSPQDAAAEPDVATSPDGDAAPDVVSVGDDGSGDGATDATDAPPDVAVCNPATLASDNRNCGSCGHDCLGSECKLGVCQPIFLLSSLIHPGAIVAADDHVYWIDDVVGRVSRATKVLPAVEDVLVYTMLPPSDLSVDATYVYYTAYSDPPDTRGGVNRVPKDHTGGVMSLITGLPTVAKLATTDAFVFCTAGDTPTQVIRSPKDQPGAEVVFTGPSDDGGLASQFLGIAADDLYVYVTDIGQNLLWRARQEPGSNERPARITRTGDRTASILVDGDYIYWADISNLYRTPRSSPFGIPDVLATAHVTSIAADSSDIYFVTIDALPGAPSRGGISRLPRVGFGQPKEVSGGWGIIDGMAIDDRAIYFTTSGKIVKLAK